MGQPSQDVVEVLEATLQERLLVLAAAGRNGGVSTRLVPLIPCLTALETWTIDVPHSPTVYQDQWNSSVVEMPQGTTAGYSPQIWPVPGEATLPPRY